MNTATLARSHAQPEVRRSGFCYRNIANAVSILGILPLPFLLMSGGYQYVIPLMIYNNIMDDLDGILAMKLGIRSEFGSILDNVCDVLAHSIFVMVIAMHHGVLCGALSIVAILAIVLRVVSRLLPDSIPDLGSPTNELVRHMLFIILLAEFYGFDATLFLLAAFILHTITMLAPLPMPYLLRSMTRSAGAVAMINLALISAWLLPMSTVAIAAGFFATYMFSFVAAALRWIAPPNPPSIPGGQIP